MYKASQELRMKENETVFQIRKVNREVAKKLRHISIDLDVPMAKALETVINHYLETKKPK
jgi:hypothetical protein